MKLHPEDPRLTAYLLGELGAEEAAAVEQAIAADPALQAAVREMESVRDLLNAVLKPSANSLLPSQRTDILRTARQADLSEKTVSFAGSRDRLKPWLIPLAAAAVIALGIFLVQRMPTAGKHSVVNSAPTPAAPKESPKSVAPAATATTEVAANETPATPSADSNLPTIGSRGPLTVTESPALELPILAGSSNINSITQSIHTERKLPARDSVRLEVMLNSFPIRPNGVTAIARVAKQAWHPDTRDEGMTAHAATLATETMTCPWKPSATLLIISIRGNAANDCDAKVVFHPNAATVSRYRMLAHAAANSSNAEKLPTRLAAKSATTLVIEIEPSTATGDLGSIEWTVNDQPAPGVKLARSGDNEPSDDARFAALVCAYAQWLAGEQSGVIDADLLSALAREIASAALPADRAALLNLIDESLRL